MSVLLKKEREYERYPGFKPNNIAAYQTASVGSFATLSYQKTKCSPNGSWTKLRSSQIWFENPIVNCFIIYKPLTTYLLMFIYWSVIYLVKWKDQFYSCMFKCVRHKTTFWNSPNTKTPVWNINQSIDLTQNCPGSTQTTSIFTSTVVLTVGSRHFRLVLFHVYITHVLFTWCYLNNETKFTNWKHCQCLCKDTHITTPSICS